jgi:hypothetical protein
LRSKLDNDAASADIEKMREATQVLEEATEPLRNAIDEAQKVMLASAHEAIFGGEKDLLESGFNDGKSTPELVKISETVKTLKSLVMVPQEHWNRQQIAGATKDVTLSRTARQESIAKQDGAKKKAGEVGGEVAAPKGSGVDIPHQVPTEGANGGIDASDALDAAILQPVAEQSSAQAVAQQSSAEPKASEAPSSH